ncbi:MAG: restriction endonuclease [Gemmatimonadota bacterium]|nr:restriction endonuclease [Gemmatimonadota bacterium]
MAIDLLNYEQRARKAVRAFWKARQTARQKQIDRGHADPGERAEVTAGKNMDGFVALAEGLIRANGLPHANIHRASHVVTLPGFFRPTKRWDVVVINDDRLIATLEFKSQAAPSFGKNFNNRAEEAIGSAHDLWIAWREGAFGEQPRPFVGWLILVEDAERSRKPVRDAEPHFPIFPEFRGASYAERYNILCRKLVQEGLYSAATVLMASRSGAREGAYTELSEMTGLRTFLSVLAGHVAGEEARGRR